jgi:hypothetical protein
MITTINADQIFSSWSTTGNNVAAVKRKYLQTIENSQRRIWVVPMANYGFSTTLAL